MKEFVLLRLNLEIKAPSSWTDNQAEEWLMKYGQHTKDQIRAIGESLAVGQLTFRIEE